MSEWIEKLSFDSIVTLPMIARVLSAALVLVIGWIAARLASRGIRKMIATRATRQTGMLVQRLVFYSLFALVLAASLQQLGVRLGVLLGAAGVLTVAIGFASQTSASNLISGLFVIAERPFVVGDVIKIGDVTGEVVSIDLLSVKLRTFDNLYVRVPNESIIKTTFTNLTHFPIRRLDMQLGVAYKDDIERVRELLAEVAHKNPLCLDEPPPLFIHQGFGDSAVQFQYSVWAQRENFLAMRNSIYEEIKATLDANGIEIPFPHRSIYTGSVTEPFPVRVVAASSGDTQEEHE